MSSIKKDDYDTFGMENDVIIGAQKIDLNENRDELFKGIKSSDQDQKDSVSTIEIKNEKTDNQPKLLDRVKRFFKFGGESDESSKENQSENKTETESQENTWKGKLLKKLQDNIEVEKSYQTFFILLMIGLGLLCLSLVFLPVIILSPYKFVLCFSLGSLIILISFLFIWGTKAYFETLFSKNRFLFTLLFLGSILLGIMFAWSQYFFFSLLCSIYQLISLIVFTLSFIPGGKVGISFIGSMLSSPFINLWMRMRGQSYLPS
jgi:hypothetical protein